MTAIGLDIARAHPAYAGHFPAVPILPGAVLLDRSLAAVADHFAIDRTGGGCRVAMAKFLSPVRPGEALRIEVEPAIAAPLPGSRSFTASVFAGDRLTMTAVLVFDAQTA